MKDMSAGAHDKNHAAGFQKMQGSINIAKENKTFRKARKTFIIKLIYRNCE